MRFRPAASAIWIASRSCAGTQINFCPPKRVCIPDVSNSHSACVLQFARTSNCGIRCGSRGVAGPPTGPGPSFLRRMALSRPAPVGRAWPFRATPSMRRGVVRDFCFKPGFRTFGVNLRPRHQRRTMKQTQTGVYGFPRRTGSMHCASPTGKGFANRKPCASSHPQSDREL